MNSLKTLAFFLFLAFYSFSTQAQTFKFGIKGGISTPDVTPNDVNPLKITNVRDSLSIKLTDANYGWHLGVWTRLGLGNFFIQPEVLFNSSSASFNAKSLRLGLIIDSLRSESYRNIDVPVMLGFKFGTLRLNAGPVGHVFLNSTSDLTNIAGLSASYNKLEWGYQAGIGLDFGGLCLDLRYEGNFSDYADHITVGNQTFAFAKKPTRLILSLAIEF